VRGIWNSAAYTSSRRLIARQPRQAGDKETICHRCRGHPRYMAY
jgi:hypothetical protein